MAHLPGLGIAPGRALQGRLEALGGFSGGSQAWELLPRQEDGVGASQSSLFENGNKWVLEAGFHGLLGWESELMLNEIIFLSNVLQGLSTLSSGELSSVACLSSIILHPSLLYFGPEKQFFR